MEPSTSGKICDICKKTDDDKYAYGEWQTVNGHQAHGFCLLFSTKSVTNANSFGMDDTMANKSNVCYVCGNGNATFTCSNKKCSRAFHVVCGEKNHCLFEFVQPYNTYCHEHHKVTQKIPESWHCQICSDTFENLDPIDYIPSCCDQGWYHRACIRKQAYFSGDNMKCPSCGEKDEKRQQFQRFIRMRGVYIPNRSALYPLSMKKKNLCHEPPSSKGQC